MTTPPNQLAAAIKFQLSEMTVHNAHHDFEHLARHLARARVYSNILPATGPVGAGGDGGRDFETFPTFVRFPITASSRFVERSSGERRVVFATSLEKRIAQKIRKDMKSIVAGGQVEEIGYFCATNLPIGHRRKLQAEASKAGIELQIFDGNAIAEWLCESELFWIAQQYLQLPAELTPLREVTSEYAASIDYWQGKEPTPFSEADFAAIRQGLRAATFNADARTDLLFWIEKARVFLGNLTPRHLTRNAGYEIAVANLRGLGDLDPAIGLVQDYFSDVGDFIGVGDLANAAALLSYSFGACHLSQCTFSRDKILNWRETLVVLIDTLSESPVGSGHHCSLLEIRGVLATQPLGVEDKPNYSRAYPYWTALLKIADSAPLFPIDSLSSTVEKLICFSGGDDEAVNISHLLDEAVARRSGSAAAGERARKRAFSLVEQEQYPAAIRELHIAKTRWFAAGELEETQRIFLTLSFLYRQLGLAYAAKYYALIAAHISYHDHRYSVACFLPKAIGDLMDAEGAAGNSFGYIHLLPQLINAHLRLDKDPFAQEHLEIYDSLGQVAALLGYLRKTRPEFADQIQSSISLWPRELFRPVLEASNNPNGFWNIRSRDDVWAEFCQAAVDTPFGDLGVNRQVEWKALGINFDVRFSNDFKTTPRAEQFIAEMQLALCALCGRDLGIIPCSLIIELVIDPRGRQVVVKQLGPNEVQIILPSPKARRSKSMREGDLLLDALVAASAVVHMCSVFDAETFVQAFGKKEVLEGIFVGRPYAELYREFVPQSSFHGGVRVSVPPCHVGEQKQTSDFEGIPWYDGVGPTFDKERAHFDAQHRYDILEKRVGLTVPSLMHDQITRSRLRHLHLEGRKDWEILSIIANISMNVQMSFAFPEDEATLKARGEAFFRTAETPETALSVKALTDDQIATHRKTFLAAHLSSWGLMLPQVYEWAGLERFLVTRYCMRDVDQPHDDLFKWESFDGSKAPDYIPDR